MCRYVRSTGGQFEFLTSQWNLEPDFVKSATAPGGTPPEGNAVFNITGEDVFLGVNAPASSSFTFPAAGNIGRGNTNVTGFGRTIMTRGSVYCFSPASRAYAICLICQLPVSKAVSWFAVICALHDPCKAASARGSEAGAQRQYQGMFDRFHKASRRVKLRSIYPWAVLQALISFPTMGALLLDCRRAVFPLPCPDGL